MTRMEKDLKTEEKKLAFVTTMDVEEVSFL